MIYQVFGYNVRYRYSKKREYLGCERLPEKRVGIVADIDYDMLETAHRKAVRAGFQWHRVIEWPSGELVCVGNC